MRRRVMIGCWLLVSSSARADGPSVSTTAADETPQSPHLFVAELGGKAGAYGLGYEHAITDRLSLGVVGSFMTFRDRQQLWTGAPYLHARLLGAEHALFGELGAVLVHSRIPSQVDDWDGMTDTGAGGVATVGYQRAGKHVVFRAYGAAMVGEGGLAPWLGITLGVRP